MMDSINTMSVSELRQIEQTCIDKFTAKAHALRGADARLTPQIARARAASLMPNTMEKYLSVCSRLTYAGQAPKPWR